MKAFGSPEALNLAQVGVVGVAEELSFGADSVGAKIALAARLLDSPEAPEFGSKILLVLKNL